MYLGGPSLGVTGRVWGIPLETYEVPLGHRLQFPNSSLEIAQSPSG